MEQRLLGLVRAGVMPLVTLTGWGAVIYMLLVGQVTAVPDWFQVAVVGNTAWWFASLRGNHAGAIMNAMMSVDPASPLPDAPRPVPGEDGTYDLGNAVEDRMRRLRAKDHATTHYNLPDSGLPDCPYCLELI